MQSIENFWEDILSQDSRRIHVDLSMLDALIQQEVIRHLNRMTLEPGWRPAQSTVTSLALEALALSNPDSGR